MRADRPPAASAAATRSRTLRHRRWSRTPARRAARSQLALRRATLASCRRVASRLDIAASDAADRSRAVALRRACRHRRRGARPRRSSRAGAARRPAARRNCLRRRSRPRISARAPAAHRAWRPSPRSASRPRLPPAGRRARWSSRIAKPGGTPASSGKRCSRRSQKAWMVCTLRPPGVSMALANSWRACSISSGDGRAIEQVRERCFRARVAGRHPFGEPIEHARRHLRRRRLGVGERQNALRLRRHRAAGAARAWSARASCRCRRWR